MAEIKQVPSLEAKKSTKSNERETICIELKLFEPTADDYPEFYVPELLKRERLKAKRAAAEAAAVTEVKTPSQQESFTQPFNNDSDCDEDVQKLAKKMEEKYGTGSGYEMINDKAAGYDESDSFIDNTEAFDEMIMDDTPRGGFYINSGPLVFKSKEKTGISGGKKRSSLDTEDEGKSAGTKKKFKGEHSSKKSKKNPSNKETDERDKEKGKTMAIKDVLRLQRDNALKKANRIVSDDEDSDSGSSAETSQDSDVKIVESPSPPAVSIMGIPDSTLPLIHEYKKAIEMKDDNKFMDLRARVDASNISPDEKNNVHAYLTSLMPQPPKPPVEEVVLDLPMLD